MMFFIFQVTEDVLANFGLIESEEALAQEINDSIIVAGIQFDQILEEQQKGSVDHPIDEVFWMDLEEKAQKSMLLNITKHTLNILC